MKRWTLIALLLVLVGGVTARTLTGAARWSEVRRVFPGNSLVVLQQPEQLTLFSISPDNSGKKPGKTLQGYPILRERPVVDPNAREEIVRAVLDGMRDQKISGARCFIPHHGLRASRGGERVEMVLCFQCRRVILYTENSRSPALISSAPQPVLDQHLSRP